MQFLHGLLLGVRETWEVCWVYGLGCRLSQDRRIPNGEPQEYGRNMTGLGVPLRALTCFDPQKSVNNSCFPHVVPQDRGTPAKAIGTSLTLIWVPPKKHGISLGALRLEAQIFRF